MMRWPRLEVTRSFRARLLIAMVLISTLPLSSFGFYTATQDRQAIAHQSSRELTGLAQGIANHLDSYLDERLADNKAIVSLPAIVGMNTGAESDLLSSLPDSFPSYASLSIFDLQGNWIVSSGPIGGGGVAQQPSFKNAVRGEQSWQIGRAMGTHRWALLIHTPVRDARSHVVGVLGAVVDLQNLTNIINRAKLEEDTRAFVLDERGSVLLHPDYSLIETHRDLSWIGVPLNGRAATPGVVHYVAADQNYVAGYAPVMNTKWVVVVERPEEEVYAAANASWRLAIIGIIVSATLAALAAVWLSRMLTQPLQSLVRAVRALGEDQSSMPALPTPSDDELRLLVDALADLRSRLAERTAERAHAERGLRLIAEASAALLSLDLDATLQSVAEVAVPALADWCAVDLLDADDTIRRAAAAHIDPTRVAEVFARTRLHPITIDAAAGVGRVIRTGEPVFQPTVSEALLADAAPTSPHLAALRALGLRSMMIVPLRIRGRVIGSMQFAIDLSDRHYTDDDLAIASELARRAATAVDNARLYREAREAVSLRDGFLSIAAHELKTPITSLKGYVQLILRSQERGRLDSDRLGRGLRIIDTQSSKLARLIGQLLDVSRITSGRLEIEHGPLDLSELARGIIAIAQAGTAAHLIDLQAPTSAPIFGDAVRLEQVLRNLLDNAIKYSPDGGSIEVTINSATNSGVQLSVRDHGLGIPEEHRGQIFDRFYRAHDDRHASGMGLGLYISREIVELHGGTIGAEFPHDGGTRLVVWLPIGAPDGTTNGASRRATST